MASEPSQPESQPERLLKEKEMTETMFAAGVSQMLEPLAVQHTDAIHKVQVSQRELETCVTQLSRKLEDAAQCSSLPQVGTYLQKLSDIKKRVGLLQSKLGNANTRLAKTYRYAEAQYGPLKSSNDAQQVCIFSTTVTQFHLLFVIYVK